MQSAKRLHDVEKIIFLANEIWWTCVVQHEKSTLNNPQCVLLLVVKYLGQEQRMDNIYCLLESVLFYNSSDRLPKQYSDIISTKFSPAPFWEKHKSEQISAAMTVRSETFHPTEHSIWFPWKIAQLPWLS